MSNNSSQNARARSANHFVAPVEETPLLAVDAVAAESQASNLWRDAWRHLRTRPMFYVSSVLIVVIVFVALFPGLFTSFPPNNQCLLANSDGAPTAGHILGYTRQGCDIFSRIVHGAGTSISVGLIVTALTASLGIFFGAFAGFYGGWIDSFLSRVGDIFFSIPYILAAVVIMSVLVSYRNVWVI